jgi:hypothetical protein
MYELQIDVLKNLARLIYRDCVKPDELKLCAEQVEARLPELSPGFRLLTDLTGLEAMDVGCAPYIRRIMELCNTRGIGLVVRVIPDPKKDIGLSIMSLFHYRRDVRILTFETLDKAVAALEGS